MHIKSIILQDLFEFSTQGPMTKSQKVRELQLSKLFKPPMLRKRPMKWKIGLTWRSTQLQNFGLLIWTQEVRAQIFSNKARVGIFIDEKMPISEQCLPILIFFCIIIFYVILFFLIHN